MKIGKIEYYSSSIFLILILALKYMHATDFLEVIKVKLSFISHDFINLLTVLPYLAKDHILMLLIYNT